MYPWETKGRNNLCRLCSNAYHETRVCQGCSYERISTWQQRKRCQRKFSGCCKKDLRSSYESRSVFWRLWSRTSCIYQWNYRKLKHSDQRKLKSWWSCDHNVYGAQQRSSSIIWDGTTRSLLNDHFTRCGGYQTGDHKRYQDDRDDACIQCDRWNVWYPKCWKTL